ncbi:MAG: YtxH protein [Chitinophagaceae bacterium]|jgi:gas vesicle protein|nr:YtxH protein [Chitinophagaceae bacterium]
MEKVHMNANGQAYKIIFTGFTALVAGVAIGTLLAPRCGAETRQKVMDTAETIRKRIMGFATRSGHTVDDVKQMLTEDIDGLNPELRGRILQMIEVSEKRLT